MKPVVFGSLEVDLAADADGRRMGAGPNVELRALDGAGGEAWRCTLEACGGQPRLMGRVGAMWVVGPWLLVQTHGEHWRGATSHAFRLHAVDQHGVALWWLEGEWLPTGLWQLGTLVLAQAEQLGHHESPCTELKLSRVSSAGVVLARRTLSVPLELPPGARVATVQLRQLASGETQLLLRGVTPRSGRRSRRWTERVTLPDGGWG